MSTVLDSNGFNINRLSPDLQKRLKRLYEVRTSGEYLVHNQVHQGDASALLPQIEPNSIALSVWSPPYFVGKEYEAHLTFDDWQSLSP
jgi:site-specific DNA-methyltransferase (adenine-specific)